MSIFGASSVAEKMDMVKLEYGYIAAYFFQRVFAALRAISDRRFGDIFSARTSGCLPLGGTAHLSFDGTTRKARTAQAR
jgi:hypothetical protein